MEVSLEQAAGGYETEIRVPSWDNCGTCKGSGAKPGTKPQTCRTCGGQGVVRIQFRIDALGRAAEVITVESSGSRLLDTAAEQAARDARELPQLYGWVRVPVRFTLERSALRQRAASIGAVVRR